MLPGRHVSEGGLDLILLKGAVRERTHGSALNTGQQEVLEPL